MDKKTVRVKYICSDIFQQVKPDCIDSLKSRVESCGDNSLYPFSRGPYQVPLLKDMHRGSNPNEIAVQVVEGYNICFTNKQVLNLLEKAMQIVSNTEEGLHYTLKKLFLTPTKADYSTPPGTLRFYSQRHICFYTGKNWRKIVP